jgi:anti-anti-sigma regulatory factor
LTSPISDTASSGAQPPALSKRLHKTITLPSVVDFEACRHLHEALRRQEAHPVCVDTQSVRHLGALALQILLSARMRWARAGLPFEIVHPSDGFIEGLSRLGLSLNSLKERV